MNTNNNTLTLWVAPGYTKYVGIAEVLAHDPSHACKLVTSHASELLTMVWNGQPVIAAGFDGTVAGKEIPHLGYNICCANGCKHPQPPLGQKAFRFFGFWFLAPYRAGDPGAGLGAIELGPLHVEVVGKYGIDPREPSVAAICARSLPRAILATVGM